MTAPAPAGAYTLETPVVTAGPADPNASARVKAYTVFSGLLGLIPVLTVFKVITTDQGIALGNAAQALIGLAGAFGFAFVAQKTSKQVKNGTFESAPQLPAVPALEQLKILRDATNATYDGAVSKAQDAADAIQAAASTAAKAIGVPDVVVDVADAGIDSLQDLLAKARKSR